MITHRKHLDQPDHVSFSCRTTHHNACDCREAYFHELEAELSQSHASISQLEEELDWTEQELEYLESVILQLSEELNAPMLGTLYTVVEEIVQRRDARQNSSKTDLKTP